VARDITTHDITLTNTGSQNITVYPSVNNISLRDGGGIEEFLPPVSSDRSSSLASWIEISRAGIELSAGEQKVVTLTLRINPNPVAGEYHAYIGFGHGRNRDIAEAQVKNGQAPGTVVTVVVGEQKNEFLRLSRFIIDRFITSDQNQASVYTINNPGDTDLVPTGEIIFYDKKGVEVASLPVNPEGAVIPAGGDQEFEAEVPTNGLLGKYKAFLSVEYGSSQLASVQDTTYFYVLPLKTIFIILGIGVIVILFLSIYIHRRYLDSEEGDSDTVPLHIRDTRSDPIDHDIDLKKNNDS
jgi:hypothetical protein